MDPTGSWYAFEKGRRQRPTAKRAGPTSGCKGKFGWEYKGKHKDLRAAYQQLQKYREALENPPLLVVCDLDRFEVHTNFTGYATKQVYAFDLDGLNDPKNVHVLRLAFTDPDSCGRTARRRRSPREIADRFAELADGLRDRGEKPDRAAHFLMKLMFCMFAEDIDLLPRGLFTETVASAESDPARLTKRLKSLFRAMADGGDFGADRDRPLRRRAVRRRRRDRPDRPRRSSSCTRPPCATGRPSSRASNVLFSLHDHAVDLGADVLNDMELIPRSCKHTQ